MDYVRPVVREDLAWAAGLFEGEGCVSIDRHHRLANGQVRAYAGLEVSMTDFDVVRRLAAIFPFGRLYEKPQQQDYQLQLRWTVRSFEYVQAAIAMIWPWLGKRRKARAREVLLECR